MLSNGIVDCDALFNCKDGPVGPYLLHRGKRVYYQTLRYWSQVAEIECFDQLMADLTELRKTCKGKGKPVLYWRIRPQYEKPYMRCRLAIPTADWKVVKTYKEGESFKLPPNWGKLIPRKIPLTL